MTNFAAAKPAVQSSAQQAAAELDAIVAGIETRIANGAPPHTHGLLSRLTWPQFCTAGTKLNN